MPKATSYTLIWSASQGYELCYPDGSHHVLGDRQSWLGWLEKHTSFSFRGQQGQMTLLKEARPRGQEGYWYAYRRQGQRRLKKYLGSAEQLSLTRLEEAASQLNPHSTTHLRHAHSDKLLSGNASLLASKLSPPRLHAHLLRRERLFIRLDSGLDGKVTLVVAPAGSGKTTLVGSWLAGGNASRQGWLALDEEDNDPIRFWRYFITACQHFDPMIGSTSLKMLYTSQRPFQETSLQPMLTALINELAALPERHLLVLEDYHLMRAPQIQEALAELVKHLPSSLHLILISRSDPHLPLAQLRARNDLHELRAEDLRFSTEEVSIFLAQTLPSALPVALVKQLVERTEGWGVGLRLAALALQGREDPREIEHILDTFNGGHHYILDYFASEILDTLSETQRMFLLQTCGLTRLTASLCDAVTGRVDSEKILAELQLANLFMTYVDDGTERWYRYHALFAEALQHEAHKRIDEQTWRQFSSRASQWYEQHGMLAEAIEMALSASEFTRVPALIGELVEPQHGGFQKSPEGLQFREHQTAYRWLARLPEEVLLQHPDLCGFFAILILFNNDREASVTRERIEQYLQAAERSWQQEDNRLRLGMAQAVRALIAMWQGDHFSSYQVARKALELLPEDAIEWRGVAMIHVGKEQEALGNLDEAFALLEEARQLCEAVNNVNALLAVTNILGSICTARGELHQAARYYQQALHLVQKQRQVRSHQPLIHDDDRAYALLGSGWLAYQWNDLTLAEEQANQALGIGKRMKDEKIQSRVLLLLAWLQAARQQEGTAAQRLQKLITQTKNPHLLTELLLGQAQLALATDDLSTAQRWLATRSTPSPYHQRREQEELLIARLLLAQGKFQETLKQSAPVRFPGGYNRWRGVAKHVAPVHSAR